MSDSFVSKAVDENGDGKAFVAETDVVVLGRENQSCLKQLNLTRQ